MPRKPDNLEGQKFGLLTAMCLDETSTKKGAYWICICECGRERSVRASSLKSGESTSCAQHMGEDLIGKTFGALTVIERGNDYIRNNGKRVVQWICKCDCGRGLLVTTSTTTLKRSRLSCKLCGIEKAKEKRIKDLTGKTFGYLKVLERNEKHIYPDGTSGIEWICECQLDGNIVSVLGKSLKAGLTKSCGCLRESYMASELKKYCVKYLNADRKENREFINSETGYSLPFDIYIPDRKVFIEVHGEQHYKMCYFHKMHSERNKTTPEEEFEYQKKKDRMKRKYARKNGIYIEIDLRKIKTVERAIEKIEKIINKL